MASSPRRAPAILFHSPTPTIRKPPSSPAISENRLQSKNALIRPAKGNRLHTRKRFPALCKSTGKHHTQKKRLFQFRVRLPRNGFYIFVTDFPVFGNAGFGKNLHSRIAGCPTVQKRLVFRLSGCVCDYLESQCISYRGACRNLFPATLLNPSNLLLSRYRNGIIRRTDSHYGHRRKQQQNNSFHTHYVLVVLQPYRPDYNIKRGVD